ncbi:MAG TPA: hypothetical protein VFI46_09720 [Jiangellaceae bacterium]|nr:hypothetical protein [Jiangellaceae bacterium]
MAGRPKASTAHVRPHATITSEPVDGGTRLRVTCTLDFEGHGLGIPLAPLVRGPAQRGAPTSGQSWFVRCQHTIEMGLNPAGVQMGNARAVRPLMFGERVRVPFEMYTPVPYPLDISCHPVER